MCMAESKPGGEIMAPTPEERLATLEAQMDYLEDRVIEHNARLRDVEESVATTRFGFLLLAFLGGLLGQALVRWLTK